MANVLARTFASVVLAACDGSERAPVAEHAAPAAPASPESAVSGDPVKEVQPPLPIGSPEVTPWFGSRGRFDEVWFAGSDASLARRLERATFGAITTEVLPGFSVDVWGGGHRGEFTIVVSEGLPFQAGPCMGGCENPSLALRELRPEVVEFEVLHEPSPGQTCRLLGFPAAPIGRLRLHKDGRIEACGASRTLVPGISPFTRWFALERAAAGPVPEGYVYCFVVSRDCTEASLQKVCRTKEGMFAFVPSTVSDPGFGWACGNGSPFFTATE